MIRFQTFRSHFTLALGACGTAVALASVPTTLTTGHASPMRATLERTIVFAPGVDESDYTFDDSQRGVPGSSIWDDDVAGSPARVIVVNRDEAKAAPTSTVAFPTDWHHCGSFFDDYPDEKLIRATRSAESVVKLPATDVQ